MTSTEADGPGEAAGAQGSDGDREASGKPPETDGDRGTDAAPEAGGGPKRNGTTEDASARDPTGEAAPMRVLNLVTNDRARFYRQQVAGLEERGVEITTIAVPNDHQPDSSRSVLDYLRIVPPTIRESFGSYDFVHANNGLTAPAALAQPTLPVLVTLWGSDLLGRYGPITRRFVGHADEVVVMSAEMADALPFEPTVIPHGVDLDRFAPEDRATARAAVGWPDDRSHVLFPYDPGREVKDFPRAERVVDAARERVDGRVELQTISGVPHARVATYMNAADLLLLPSEREGSPNAVKEAMACNVPVVATDVGDVAERLDDVAPSVVSDDDEELSRAVARILQRGERSNGRERVAADLSVDATADRLFEVYRSIARE